MGILPWLWDPSDADAYHTLPNTLTPADCSTHIWPYGRLLFMILSGWFNTLQWPDSYRATGSSFLELAIDFEVSTGFDLPCCCKTSCFTRPIGCMCKAFEQLLLILEQISPSPVVWGERKQNVSSLRCIGLPVLRGIGRKPLFVGGKNTIKALERLPRATWLRTPTVSKNAWLKSTHTSYTELGRRASKLIWVSNHFTLSPHFEIPFSSVRPPIQATFVAYPLKAPANVLAFSPKIPICGPHSSSKCPECVHELVTFCCFHHHASLSLPTYSKLYCHTHRLSACGACALKQHDAAHCCRLNHHACKSHDLPTCDLCVSNKYLKHPCQPQTCCKRHHSPRAASALHTATKRKHPAPACERAQKRPRTTRQKPTPKASPSQSGKRTRPSLPQCPPLPFPDSHTSTPLSSSSISVNRTVNKPRPAPD